MTEDFTKIGACNVVGSFDGVREALKTVNKLLEDIVAIEQMAAIELCMAETLNNIVEHGYKEKAGGRINIQVERSNAVVCFSVSDTGHPNLVMSEQALPDASFDPDAMADGGYGFSLMQTIASRLDYRRVDGVNVTTIWCAL